MWITSDWALSDSLRWCPDLQPMAFISTPCSSQCQLRMFLPGALTLTADTELAKKAFSKAEEIKADIPLTIPVLNE